MSDTNNKAILEGALYVHEATGAVVQRTVTLREDELIFMVKGEYVIIPLSPFCKATLGTAGAAEFPVTVLGTSMAKAFEGKLELVAESLTQAKEWMFSINRNIKEAFADALRSTKNYKLRQDVPTGYGMIKVKSDPMVVYLQLDGAELNMYSNHHDPNALATWSILPTSTIAADETLLCPAVQIDGKTFLVATVDLRNAWIDILKKLHVRNADRRRSQVSDLMREQAYENSDDEAEAEEDETPVKIHLYNMELARSNHALFSRADYNKLKGAALKKHAFNRAPTMDAGKIVLLVAGKHRLEDDEFLHSVLPDGGTVYVAASGDLVVPTRDTGAAVAETAAAMQRRPSTVEEATMDSEQWRETARQMERMYLDLRKQYDELRKGREGTPDRAFFDEAQQWAREVKDKEIETLTGEHARVVDQLQGELAKARGLVQRLERDNARLENRLSTVNVTEERPPSWVARLTTGEQQEE